MGSLEMNQAKWWCIGQLSKVKIKKLKGKGQMLEGEQRVIIGGRGWEKRGGWAPKRFR